MEFSPWQTLRVLEKNNGYIVFSLRACFVSSLYGKRYMMINVISHSATHTILAGYRHLTSQAGWMYLCTFLTNLLLFWYNIYGYVFSTVLKKCQTYPSFGCYPCVFCRSWSLVKFVMHKTDAEKCSQHSENTRLLVNRQGQYNTNKSCFRCTVATDTSKQEGLISRG